MDQNKEGSFYASKVRLFLNEYGGINLQEFCKAEHVSYTKMCHCLGRPSYRKPKVASTPPIPEDSHEEDGVLPVIDLQPLVVDMPAQPADSSSSVPSPFPGKQQQRKETAKCRILSDVTLSLSGRMEVRIGSCEIGALITLMKEMEVTPC